MNDPIRGMVDQAVVDQHATVAEELHERGDGHSSDNDRAYGHAFKSRVRAMGIRDR
jgi:hypothetical protein